MTTLPASTDRLLVLAPHPDDESLACGGLLQRALRAGAEAWVAIATNGDANPWPQRLAERRWRLGPGDAARWGARRAGEARDALRILGVDQSRIRFLDWPDQGLTQRLADHADASIATLRDLLRRVRPTLVAAPALHDSHPDHSALALLLQAALRAEGISPRVLAYWLHGRHDGVEGASRLDLAPAELARKREAALAHRSQTLFGRGRLLAHVRACEDFFEEPPASAPAGATWRWRFEVHPVAARLARRLHVAALTVGGELRAASFALHGAGRPDGLRLRRDGRAVEVELPAPWPEADCAVAKLDHPHRLYVYDTCAWRPAQPGTVTAPPARGKDAERHPLHTGSLPLRDEPDMRPWKILCDFDGTICLPDATDALLERLAAPEWRMLERQWREGLLGSRECMARQVALIDASEDDIDAVLEAVRMDPAFPAFVAQARALGIELAVVSDGLDRAIHAILRRHGLDDLPLVANRFERTSARGWRFDSPHADAACRAESGTCKCAWAARAQDAGERILLIGDGQSDVCVSARADFVFAKSRLLAHCRDAGLPHRAIAGFDDAIALLPELAAGRLDALPLLPSRQAEFA